MGTRRFLSREGPRGRAYRQRTNARHALRRAVLVPLLAPNITRKGASDKVGTPYRIGPQGLAGPPPAAPESAPPPPANGAGGGIHDTGSGVLRPGSARAADAPTGLVNLAHLPQNCWGRLVRPKGYQARPNSPLSARNERGGAGGGPLSDAVRCSSSNPGPSEYLPQRFWGRSRGDERVGAPADAPGLLSKRDRILPSPRGTSGEGPGEGPLAGAARIPSSSPVGAVSPPSSPVRRAVVDNFWTGA